MKYQLHIGKLCVQDHTMPKYLGATRTSARSYLRVFWSNKFIFGIPWWRTSCQNTGDSNV